MAGFVGRGRGSGSGVRGLGGVRIITGNVGCFQLHQFTVMSGGSFGIS